MTFIHANFFTDADHEAQATAAEAFEETHGTEWSVSATDPEDRQMVDEGDVELVSQADRDALDLMLAWEEFVN